MLTIRLQRTGKRNQADFRIVLAEKQAPVKKKHLEILGSYNPRKKDFRVKEERVKYWITQRVEISPTVRNLFVAKGLMEGPKVKAFNTPKKEPEKSEAPATAQTPVEPVAVIESVSAIEVKNAETPVAAVASEKSDISDKVAEQEKSDKAEEPAKAE